jgi:heme exporter protein C
MAAVSAAEAGMVFMSVVLITGPIWGAVAWGAYWRWEDLRLVLTLLLWFVFLGYFLVRSSTANPERGRRLAAIVAIVGVLDIPFIHISVKIRAFIHPQPVVMNPDGPTLPPDMLTTLLLGLLAFTLLFAGILLLRFGLEQLSRGADRAVGAHP